MVISLNCSLKIYKMNIKLYNSSSPIVVQSEPKVTFLTELWVGKVRVPVKTELDFSGVHPSQHGVVLKAAVHIYYKNR